MEAECESVGVSLEKVQEFQSWARKIKPLLHLLDKSPSSELELKICSDENGIIDDMFLMDKKLVDKCEILYNELVTKSNEQKKNCKDLMDKVLFPGLRKLEDKEEFNLGYSCADSRVIKLMENFESLFKLMDQERSQRVQVYIGELRKEISDIWNKCMITEEEKNEFKEFHSNLYTEEILDIHKEELKKWQIYHTKNQEILTKILTRDDMWVKLRELEAKADDPNRFVNRGGALLKDQNMLNSITKNLPKLEAELIKLADQFQEEHGRTMKIRGKEIASMVDEDWKLFKEEKAAKKNHRLIATPGSVPLRATRQSIKPPQILQSGGPSSSCKPGDKRRLPPGTTVPFPKRKFTSSDSLLEK